MLLRLEGRGGGWEERSSTKSARFIFVSSPFFPLPPSVRLLPMCIKYICHVCCAAMLTGPTASCPELIQDCFYPSLMK